MRQLWPMPSIRLRRGGSVLLVTVWIVLALCTASGAQNRRSADEFSIDKVNAEAFDSEAVDTAQRGGGGSATSQQAERPNLTMVAFRTIAALVLILLVIVGLVWFLRKAGLSGTSRIGGGSMDLLEVLPIGQGRSIVLVRVMEKVLVLAQTQQNITLLEEVDGQHAVELIAQSKGGTSIVQFKEMFNNFVGRVKKN
jgi:flagellar biosynthetic protein FliO